MFIPPVFEKGWVRIFFADGTNATLARNEFEPLCAALRRSTIDADDAPTWYEGMDVYGDQTVIRLDAVTQVQEASPSGVAAAHADDKARTAYRKATGDDD